MLEEADQQVKLYLQLAHEAYSDKQMLRALHYFQRALDFAQEKGHDLDGTYLPGPRVCLCPRRFFK